MQSFSLESHLPIEPAALAERARHFARTKLGPASGELLSRAEVQALVLSKIRDGRALEDAVLAVSYRAARSDPKAADEFLAYFLNDLMRMGHYLLSPGLRRFLDTGDLVHSVLGNLWKEIREVRFETRSQFLAYLSNGLRWKASGNRRKYMTWPRRTLGGPAGVEASLQLESEVPGPATAAGLSEEASRLTLVLHRLPERDREILRLYLLGAKLPEIARELDLSSDAARQALRRAIRRARCLT